ncbi:MAG: nucleotidyltransferase family protein [Elusimicrobiota bacterium]
MLIINKAEEIAGECRKRNIDLCQLKGSALIISGVYEIWERDMEDIDILIREKDLYKFEYMMRNTGYGKVCSGERGFYKAGENVLIDIHTDIPYARGGMSPGIWKRMKKINGMFVMDDVDHLIYIIYHGLMHHAADTGHWKEDAERLMISGIDGRALEERISRYGLSELFCIASEYCGWEKPRMRQSGLKRKYMELVISMPGFEDKGHFLRPLASKGIKSKLLFFFDFIFPDLDFLERRYRIRPSALMLFFRPLLLMLKVLQVAFFLNPLKGCFKT